MYYVYILRSERDGKLYIGMTIDLRRRFSEHSAGTVTSTKSRRPFTLIYYEAHHSRGDAERRERYFKTDRGKSTLRMMLRDTLAGRPAQVSQSTAR